MVPTLREERVQPVVLFWRISREKECADFSSILRAIKATMLSYGMFSSLKRSCDIWVRQVLVFDMFLNYINLWHLVTVTLKKKSIHFQCILLPYQTFSSVNLPIFSGYLLVLKPVFGFYFLLSSNNTTHSLPFFPSLQNKSYQITVLIFERGLDQMFSY